MIIARDPGALNRIKTLALHGLTRDAWRRFSDDGFKHYQVVPVTEVFMQAAQTDDGLAAAGNREIM